MPSPDSAHDVIVVGVGGMGSATTYHLAKRGLDVLGLERYDIPHTKGSSHGHSRIIRRAYYEDPSYVPLIERAYKLWDRLADETNRAIIHRTGSVDAGPPADPVFAGSKRSCEEHDIPHEILDGAALAERFPGYRLPETFRAVYQEDGGFVVPEEAIAGHVQEAQAAGATVRAREAVEGWSETSAGGVRVDTVRGRYEADALVLTAGAWNRQFAEPLEKLLEPERQVLAWFQPQAPERFRPSSFPVWNLSAPEGRFYGLPIYRVPGFKLGKYHHRDERVDPDDWNGEPEPADEQLLREFTEAYFPAAAGPTMGLSTCLFTNSPDEHFILDTLPNHPQVVVAGGFSGHGFKFASVIGSILADLALEGETDHPIGPFALDRFE